MRKPGKASRRIRRIRVKNPVATTRENAHPFPQMRTVASVPGVGAVLKRARTPYKKRPLTEDEALNLICDARSDEPTYPIKKLLKKIRA